MGSALLVSVIAVIFVIDPGLISRSGSPTIGSRASSPKALLAVIDSTTQVLSIVALDVTPGPVVFAEGSVWFVDETGSQVLRVDHMTRRVVARIAVGQDPVDLAVGAGSIWVANHAGRSVSRIDPAANDVAETIALDFPPVRIGASDRAVWVAGAGVLGRGDRYPKSDLATIEPATNQVIDSARFRAAAGCAPFLGADAGEDWAASALGEVWKLDPQGGRPAREAKRSGMAWAGMFVDQADGAIWLGSDGSPGQIVSLDPSTGLFSRPIRIGTTKDRIGSGCEPIWITVGGRYLWATNADDDSVSVIDRTSRQGVGSLGLGGRPTGLAFGVEHVWVVVDLRSQPHG